MSNNVLFYTQIFTIIIYVLSLFTLYRLLVSQKDATIETLKERIGLLEKELDKAKAASPDILAETYAKRVDLLKAELSRLSTDQDSNKKKIREKTKQLEKVQNEMRALKSQMEEAQQNLERYLCPFCGAGIKILQDYVDESGEIDPLTGSDHYVLYECGAEYIHGRLAFKCSGEKKTDKEYDHELKRDGP